jgi:hypothetical protein
VDQWATLRRSHVIAAFVTVVAIKGVKLVGTTLADDGDKIINCSAFDDTIVSVRILQLVIKSR